MQKLVCASKAILVGETEVKDRLVVFSFYDKDGYLDDYKLNIIREFSLCTRRVIVVVNGEIEERFLERLCECEVEMHVRENKGFDAGSYKYVLSSVVDRGEIKKYQEVIFCNDTFFGPFVSFEKIFEEMDKKECDFWGLTGCTNILFPYIQSYFVAFREAVIAEGVLHDYFDDFVEEDCTDINKVYCQFESGLFDYFVREKGLKYDLFANDSNLDIYKSSYYYLKDLNAPILKKKCFAPVLFDEVNVYKTLRYVCEETSYDLNLIEKSICRVYVETVDFSRIGDFGEEVPKKIHTNTGLLSEKEIENFIEEESFYIYGAGVLAYKTYWRIARHKTGFKGFIISDGQEKKRESIYGYPVYFFSEVVRGREKILLAVNHKFTEEVIRIIGQREHILKLY